MIRKCQVIFCDNEHGTGDVTFPDICALDPQTVQQVFIEGNTTNELRKAAKLAGWGRVNGGDYCPGCIESGV